MITFRTRIVLRRGPSSVTVKHDDGHTLTRVLGIHLRHGISVSDSDCFHLSDSIVSPSDDESMFVTPKAPEAHSLGALGEAARQVAAWASTILERGAMTRAVYHAHRQRMYELRRSMKLAPPTTVRRRIDNGRLEISERGKPFVPLAPHHKTLLRIE